MTHKGKIFYSVAVICGIMLLLSAAEILADIIEACY